MAAAAIALKTLVWISFDLGVRGDYEGMYAWLDEHETKECGESVACFSYEHSGDLLADLTKDLWTKVQIDDKKNRINVIKLESGKMKGNFIFGRRRNAPWVGTAETSKQEEDVSG